MSEDKIGLKDVYQIANRIEDKFDSKMGDFDDRLSGLEAKTNNLIGKITILMVIISAAVTIAVQIINKNL